MAQKPEYIKNIDPLNDGREKINKYAIDPAYRAELNSEVAISNVNKLGKEVTESVNEATRLATKANDNSNSTQKQLDTLVIESGTSDAEVVQTRTDLSGKEHDLLKDRVLAIDMNAYTYSSIGEVKGLNIPEGTIIKTNFDGKSNNFKIVKEAAENGHSVFKLDNGLFAVRVFDKYNSYLSLVNGSFSLHKGFNGYYTGATKRGLHPANTTVAFNEAGEMGERIVELDARMTKDGQWVVSHDDGTHGLSGELTTISELTLEELKQRTLVKQYLDSGIYWNYDNVDKDYKVPTLEEVLLICKKFNMIVQMEFKSPKVDYLEDDYKRLADIVKRTGMEASILFFGRNAFVNRVMRYLDDSIAGFNAAYTDNQIDLNTIKSYKNHCLVISKDEYDKYETFSKNNNIPVIVWTVDNYREAESLFNRGVNVVSTNTLVKNMNKSSYKEIYRYDKFSFIESGWNTNGGVNGTISIDENNQLKFDVQTGYLSKYRNFSANNALKVGDVIEIKATGYTDTQTNNVARVTVSNSKNGNEKLQQELYFDKNEPETKTIYYFVTDTSMTTIHVGAAGDGIAGKTIAYFKEIDISILRKVKSVSNERYGFIYAYDGAFAFRPQTVNKGLKSIGLTSDKGSLLLEFEPFQTTGVVPIIECNTQKLGVRYDHHVVANYDSFTSDSVLLEVYDKNWVRVSDLSVQPRLYFTVSLKGE